MNFGSKGSVNKVLTREKRREGLKTSQNSDIIYGCPEKEMNESLQTNETLLMYLQELHNLNL